MKFINNGNVFKLEDTVELETQLDKIKELLLPPKLVKELETIQIEEFVASLVTKSFISSDIDIKDITTIVIPTYNIYIDIVPMVLLEKDGYSFNYRKIDT